MKVDAARSAIKKEYKFHPYCIAWPELTDEELLDLADSIKAEGLHNEVIRNRDGMIIDGRSRLIACKIAGVKPKFKQFKGKSAVEFIFSQNHRRRHSSQSVLAAMAVEGQAFREKEEEARARQKKGSSDLSTTSGTKVGRTSEHIAREAGVSRNYVDRAKKLKKDDPKLFNDVRKGKVSLHQATQSSGKKVLSYSQAYNAHAKSVLQQVAELQRACKANWRTYPPGFRDRVDSLVKQAAVLKTWDPKKGTKCPKCKGTGLVKDGAKGVNDLECPDCCGKGVKGQ